MSVATKARALVSRAVAAVSVGDVRGRVSAAEDNLAASEAALEEALGQLALGSGTEEAVTRATALRDKARLEFKAQKSALTMLELDETRRERKAAEDRETATWMDAKRLADERAALLERFVADCKRLETTVRELESVNRRLDDISPRRKAAPHLRGMIGGKQQLDRLLAIMKWLVTSLHRQPGIQPHEKGVEHFIKNEIDMGRQFGDRNFKGE